MSETPLQRAQRLTREFEPRRLELVEYLRREGWSRDDAVAESFDRLNRYIHDSEDTQRASEPHQTHKIEQVE